MYCTIWMEVWIEYGGGVINLSSWPINMHTQCHNKSWKWKLTPTRKSIADSSLGIPGFLGNHSMMNGHTWKPNATCNLKSLPNELSLLFVLNIKEAAFFCIIFLLLEMFANYLKACFLEWAKNWSSKPKCSEQNLIFYIIKKKYLSLHFFFQDFWFACMH